MKRLVYLEKDKYYLEKVNKRQCATDEVEIETKISGLCGSDIQKLLRQTPDEGYLHTNVLGHEIMGIITQTGTNCTKLNIGDRVVVNPFILKDENILAESLSFTYSDIVGRTKDGGFSELIYLPENCAIRLPESIQDEEAIFIDDIAVVMHTKHILEKHSEKGAVNKIAVLGDGTLGILSAKIFSYYYGQDNVVLFSKTVSKLKKVTNVNIVDNSCMTKFKEKFDVIVEAVGGNQSTTLNDGIMLGKNNSIILCLGVYQFGFKAEVDVRTAFYKQMLIKGVNSYCNMYNDFDLAMKLLEEKNVSVVDLITNEIKFSEFTDYLQNYENNKSKKIKTLIRSRK
ncbi:MAG: alcohol dehydrogenase catalytic domain-containing protein [Bacilli bacterium]|nr:alcohol dehydrogenase catalytic domain-containing protein [Bacilli bacterium]